MMMDVKEIEHMAILARIALSPEGKTELNQQMNKLLTYIEKLNELNTAAIEPLYHILPLHNVFREDLAVESPPREELLFNAPQCEDGFYKVPRIL